MIEGPKWRAAGPLQTNDKEVETAELKNLSLPWAPLLQIGKVSLKFRSTTSLCPNFLFYPGRTLHVDLAICLVAGGTPCTDLRYFNLPINSSRAFNI